MYEAVVCIGKQTSAYLDFLYLSNVLGLLRYSNHMC